MKKKFFAYMITGILLFTFLAQGKGTKTYWFQIASQGEGESGFLTNSNLNQKKVYLTFDDGPSDHTAQILDILKKHKVKATFFVVGKETEHAKKMYQRIVLEGHTLAMHSSQNKVIPFCSHIGYTVLYFLRNDYCCHPETGKYMALHLLDHINISVVS